MFFYALVWSWMSLEATSTWCNFSVLSNRTRIVCASENSNPVTAAGCGRTSKKRESEATSLFAEFQAQVSTSQKGKTDMGRNFPEPVSILYIPGWLRLLISSHCVLLFNIRTISTWIPSGHTEINQGSALLEPAYIHSWEKIYEPVLNHH